MWFACQMALKIINVTQISLLLIFHTAATQLYPAPWFVHLDIIEENGMPNGCSGTLITPSLVLTAAHCLETWGNWSVYAGHGNNQQQNVKAGIERRLKSYSTHYDYAIFRNRAYNLVILSLDRPYVLGPTIERVQFPTLPVFDLPLPDTTISPELEPLYPLNRWHSCQIVGSGWTFNEAGTNCEETNFVRRFMPGALFGVECCNTMIRIGQEMPFPADSFCIVINSDSACSGGSGAGVTCLSSTDDTPALVGVIVSEAHCCDSRTGRKTRHPVARNIVPMDYGRRQWIRNVVNYYYFTGVMPGDALPDDIIVRKRPTDLATI